jgi:dihydrofolate synthase/folylpolyglutamate synthase
MPPTRHTLADWLAYIEAQHPKSIDMGLERVREVAVRIGLGRPARHVITVAGTNGKGSTVAFIDSIARAGGWRAGAYTSPHLLRYNERVRIDGVEASDEALVEAFEVVEAARLSPSPTGRGVGVRGRSSGARSNTSDSAGSSPVLQPSPPLDQQQKPLPLTYFEFGTLAALWLFERSELDLAILEVGLGGRLDATNLVDPDVAVITTVDLDHQDWLGEDRETIGLEKAGIARAWTPLVLGEDDPPASVLRHAYAIGASAIRAGCDFMFDTPADAQARSWTWREVGFELELPLPQLAAPVQLRNAAVAITALRALDAPFDEEAFARGVAAARIPARLQRFDVDGAVVLVDVGHNPQAARELAAALRAAPAPGRTFAIYSALADKEHAAVVNALAPQVDAWLLAGSTEAGPRGQTADDLATRVAGTVAAVGVRHRDIAEALTAARARAEAGDRILVFGSFHAAAEALRVLNAS